MSNWWWKQVWSNPPALRSYIAFMTFTPGLMAGVALMIPPYGWAFGIVLMPFVVYGGGLGLDRLEQLARMEMLNKSPFTDYGGPWDEKSGAEGHTKR